MKHGTIPRFMTKTGVAVQPLRRLVVPLSVKAASIDTNARTFEGLAAVWDQDLGDDVIHKGAFKSTLSDWKSSGEAMPLLNSHNHFDIFDALGQLIEAKETPEGLWTKWEVIDGPDGDRVMARLRPSKTTKRPIVGKMSIGFVPVEFRTEKTDKARFGEIRHLEKVDLKEVSLVMFPMAPGASIDASSVKHFLESAANTDPKDVPIEVKQDLRRLASRIGILLKQQKSEADPAEPAAEGAGAEPAEPSAPAEPNADNPSDNPSDPPETPASPAPASSDDPAPEVEVDADDEADDADPAAGEGEGAPTEEKQSVYLYDEALQQRIRKTLLRNKTSELKENSTS